MHSASAVARSATSASCHGGHASESVHTARDVAGVLSEVEPGADRDSAYLEELCRACAEDWTADLVDLTLLKLQTSEIAFCQGWHLFPTTS